MVTQIADPNCAPTEMVTHVTQCDPLLRHIAVFTNQYLPFWLNYPQTAALWLSDIWAMDDGSWWRHNCKFYFLIYTQKLVTGPNFRSIGQLSFLDQIRGRGLNPLPFSFPILLFPPAQSMVVIFRRHVHSRRGLFQMDGLVFLTTGIFPNGLPGTVTFKYSLNTYFNIHIGH